MPKKQAGKDRVRWGSCSWNSFGMLYAFAGFNGYLLLGHYLKDLDYHMCTAKREKLKGIVRMYCIATERDCCVTRGIALNNLFAVLIQ